LEKSLNKLHSAPLNTVVHQLEKSWGSMSSFSKALSRTLKKYIPDGTEVHGELCPTCGSKLIRISGCSECEQKCGFTKCG